MAEHVEIEKSDDRPGGNEGNFVLLTYFCIHGYGPYIMAGKQNIRSD